MFVNKVTLKRCKTQKKYFQSKTKMDFYTINPGNPINGGYRKRYWGFIVPACKATTIVMTPSTGQCVTVNTKQYVIYIGPDKKPTQTFLYKHHVGMIYAKEHGITRNQTIYILQELNIPAENLRYVQGHSQRLFLRYVMNLIKIVPDNYYNNHAFNCDQCEYQSENKFTLKKHQNARHLNIRYSCQKCSYKATQAGHLVKHVNTKHCDTDMF